MDAASRRLQQLHGVFGRSLTKLDNVLQIRLLSESAGNTFSHCFVPACNVDQLYLKLTYYGPEIQHGCSVFCASLCKSLGLKSFTSTKTK